MRSIIIFLTLIFIISCTSSIYSQTESIGSLPRIYTEGNQFIQEDGDSVSLRGVSLCSLAWHNPQQQISDVTDPIFGWNVSIIRLPIQVRMWEIEGANAYMRKRIDPAVKLCNENNVYCILDWHQIGNWTDPAVNENLFNFWENVAPRYANNPNILFELFNEPTRPKARTQENWDLYREYAQNWVNHVRELAPDTVLLIGSPHWSQSSSFAVNNPIDGENIAYVTHVYPLWKQSRWDSLFGNAAEHIPMILTEWGFSTVSENKILSGTIEAFAEPLKEYLNERPHIGWTAWSYDPKCGPAMLGEDTDMAKFVRDWLSNQTVPK